ncbi:uncharacterized protein YecE (DUF72 family) [Allonocardiopsis opalescens]|uniref:Uncharacterized protein YecE (DUF72 family) n=1 Tax=Allonocardiopsis opalescens TaxID=1144618 RepID=A0A2T0Q2Y0_9ACTN|nr:uncharacterized protein YecE (DUF72 family) [Allonocardiopsis opalescens]
MRYYASVFPVVEVDASFYALPGAERSRAWVERTPKGFVFDVKAFALMTGHRAQVGRLPPELRPSGPPTRSVGVRDLGPDGERMVWRAFLDGIAPLRDGDRLGSVLLQFPPSFAPGPGARARIARCAELAEGVPLAVEFRHPAWLTGGRRAGTPALLREHGMALVAVDTAQNLPTSMPPVAEATCEGLAVVRFHGRSPHWGTGSKEDRFRHHYTREDLLPWLPRVRRLAEGADSVHVLFNNCCGDASVTAARLMSELLEAAD